MAITLTVGNSYTLGGFDWICAEINGNCATLQSKGMTSGSWPAYKLTSDYEGTTSFGEADTAYASNIDGLNIANYDGFTSVFYEKYKDVEFKNAAYGKGLFLVSNAKCGTTTSGGQGSGNYWQGLYDAAVNSSSYGSTDHYSRLGTVDGDRFAWYVADNRNIYGNSVSQNRIMVIAPAFNLDISNPTLKLVGSAITAGYTVDKIYIGDSNKEAVLIDKPYPVKMVSWANGSWAEIAAMAYAYYNNELTIDDIKEFWTIGDTRTMPLKAMAATGVGESHRAQNVKMQILDFEHDNLTTAVNGHTKALLSLDLKDCLMDAACEAGTAYGSTNTENGYINSTNTNVGGWKDSARRTWCNSVFYNALPSEFKALIKQVQKVTSKGNQLTTTDTTDDYCYLLSEYEIFGTVTYSAVQEGEQYALYANAVTNRYKKPFWDSGYSFNLYWNRSPYKLNSTQFCYTYGSDPTIGAPSFPLGLSVAMSI